MLARSDLEETVSDAASVDIQETLLPAPEEVDEITTLSVDQSGDFIFCGTENGLINVHKADTAKLFQKSIRHHARIRILAFDSKTQILASADASSTVLVHQLSLQPSKQWVKRAMIFESRVPEPVEDIVFRPDGSMVLIVTTTQDELWSLKTKSKVNTAIWSTRNRGIWKNNAKNTDQLLLIIASRIRIYSWKDLKAVTSNGGLDLDFDNPPDFDLRAAYFKWSSHCLILELGDKNQRRGQIQFTVWNMEDISTTGTKQVSPDAERESFSAKLTQLVGSSGSIIIVINDMMLFFDHDGWVCSVDTCETMPEFPRRHFYLPSDWLTTNGRLLFAFIAATRRVVFRKAGDLAVIKRGLECVEKVPF